LKAIFINWHRILIKCIIKHLLIYLN